MRKKKSNSIKKKSIKSIVEGTWKFDNEVAKIFDKHVNQSVPHYNDIQNYVVKLSEWFLKDETIIYDLACSTGETIKKITELKVTNKTKIIGIDSNKKMIDLAKIKLNRKNIDKKKFIIEFNNKDLLKIKKFKKSNLFISILLFPFINLRDRKSILNKIYNSLDSGGAFICVEKIRSHDPIFEDILNQMYFDYKISKKLTEKEILDKARSLRSSMYLFDENTSFQLLRETGFNHYETFFKCFNFLGYIAIK